MTVHSQAISNFLFGWSCQQVCTSVLSKSQPLILWAAPLLPGVLFFLLLFQLLTLTVKVQLKTPHVSVPAWARLPPALGDSGSRVEELRMCVGGSDCESERGPWLLYAGHSTGCYGGTIHTFTASTAVGGEADRHRENWMFLEANLKTASLRGRAQ